MDIMLQIVLLAVGFLMLVKGADWFVDGAAGIAEKFGIPQLVVGLTIVAMGTSAPEAAVSITAAMSGSADITIGNIVGSNIMNILVILGVSAVIVSIPVAKSTVKIEMPYMIAMTVLLLLFGITGNQIVWWEGLVLWAAFLLYLGYLLYMALKDKEEEGMQEEKPVWKLLLLTAIGIVLVVWGSDVTVDAASHIAAALGMSERFIGLTIVAFGTSLPELCTSVVAAKRKKADLAIGNIVGSNIFNILFVVGTTALITPVSFVAAFTVDTIAAIAAALLLWICVVRSKRLNRTSGIVMLVAYAAYFVYLVCIR